MLHLAQVTKNPLLGAIELQVLALQQSDRNWALCDRKTITGKIETTFNEGVLVLVVLDENDQIVEVKNAADWVIALIEDHFTSDQVVSEFYQSEQSRIEQWRQEITAKSLDLTRRQLELETHQEQVQELEARLKQEQENLEIRLHQLQLLEEQAISDPDHYPS